MGRRPDPPDLRVLKGTGHGAPAFPPSTVSVVQPPMTAKARTVWKRLAPDLIAKQVLDPWNADLFGQYCEAVVIARTAAAELARRGLLVAGQKGEDVKNPAVQIWRDATATASAIASKFGLPPIDRRHVPTTVAGGTPGGPNDPYRYLSGGKDGILSDPPDARRLLS